MRINNDDHCGVVRPPYHMIELLRVVPGLSKPLLSCAYGSRVKNMTKKKHLRL